MSEVLEFYQKQAQSTQSAHPFLAQAQKRALKDLQHWGFPTRHHEEWKYTRLDGFYQQRFTNQLPALHQPTSTQAISFGLQLVIENGRLLAHDPLPNGVEVASLEQFMQNKPQLLQAFFNQSLTSQHAFHALNTAALNTGLVIHITSKTCVDTPLVLNFWQDKAEQALHNRIVIIAEADSQATIIEHFHGADDVVYFTNTITEVALAQQASLQHYKIQREGNAAFHIGHLAVKQAKQSRCDSHSFSFGGSLVRSDSSFYLEEEGANCLLNGIYMPAKQQHIDHHTTVHHLVPDCQSNQDYKGILLGQSRAVFNGKVIVSKDAQHTQASQQNKNLLLSTKAEINTKPQLEIFADDVICSHGATVGQLDDDALFYLATRGIAPDEARQFLIRAFAADNLRLVGEVKLTQWLAHLIYQQLG